MIKPSPVVDESSIVFGNAGLDEIALILMTRNACLPSSNSMRRV